MTRPAMTRPASAGILGCLTFVLIGWSGLLIPSLIRSVKAAFDQNDAGIGILYFVYAAADASGSLGAASSPSTGLGLLSLGLAPSWMLFVAFAIPAGLGAGALDGGVNGLFLDVFRTARGRALNVLHLFFSLGARSAPLVVGRFVEAGIAWPSLLAATGVAALVVTAALALVTMPTGRRSGSDRSPAVDPVPGPTRRPALPLILLAVAIACYVASEVGVSNWLVRFLEAAPLTTATSALALFWAGLTLGRLVSSRVADRFDHLQFTIVASVATAGALLGAILVPSLPLSIALFGLTGFVTGPVFPMIIAIGGERYPDRSAAVSGLLAGAAAAGSVVYPPVMGFLSVTVGLTVAMIGSVILALVCAGFLVLVARGHGGTVAGISAGGAGGVARTRR